jgi:hypothetical protein
MSTLCRSACALSTLVLATGLGACGGSSKNSATQPVVTPGHTSDPAGTVLAFAQRLGTLAKSKSCADDLVYQRLFVNRVAIPCRRSRAGLRHFFVTGAEVHGTGGIIDFTDAAAPRGATLVLARGSKGAWNIAYDPTIGTKTVGTHASDTAPYAQTVDMYIRALRQKDCHSLFKYALTSPADRPATFCSRTFAAGLSDLLIKDPAAKPVAMGGNAFVQFYGLSVRPGHYGTLPVAGPIRKGVYIVVSPIPER